MTRRLLVLLLAIFLGTGVPAEAQRRAKKETKKSMKEQSERKADNKAKIFNEYKSKEEKHFEIQDRATRKRMKANRKRQKRLSNGKPLPFYKRWFKKRRIK